MKMAWLSGVVILANHWSWCPFVPVIFGQNVVPLLYTKLQSSKRPASSLEKVLAFFFLQGTSPCIPFMRVPVDLLFLALRKCSEGDCFSRFSLLAWDSVIFASVFIYGFASTRWEVFEEHFSTGPGCTVRWLIPIRLQHVCWGFSCLLRFFFFIF